MGLHIINFNTVNFKLLLKYLENIKLYNGLTIEMKNPKENDLKCISDLLKINSCYHSIELALEKINRNGAKLLSKALKRKLKY
jgi:hypothetical protein